VRTRAEASLVGPLVRWRSLLGEGRVFGQTSAFAAQAIVHPDDRTRRARSEYPGPPRLTGMEEIGACLAIPTFQRDAPRRSRNESSRLDGACGAGPDLDVRVHGQEPPTLTSVLIAESRPSS
jgi:hypothetical protein